MALTHFLFKERNRIVSCFIEHTVILGLWKLIIVSLTLYTALLASYHTLLKNTRGWVLIPKEYLLLKWLKR
jgi:hypothetical protein